MNTDVNLSEPVPIVPQGNFYFRENVKYLSKLNGKYWGFRRRVPKNLRCVVGRREIWRTHNSVNFSFARIRHARELRVFENYFAKFEHGGEIPGPLILTSAIEEYNDIKINAIRAKIKNNTEAVFSKLRRAVRHRERAERFKTEGSLHLIYKALCSDDEINDEEENYTCHADGFISDFMLSLFESKYIDLKNSNIDIDLSFLDKKDISLLNKLFRGIVEWRGPS